MMNKILIKRRIGVRSIRRVAAILLVTVILLLSQALPVLSADEDLYTANWLQGATALLEPGSGSWDDTGVGVSCVSPDGLKMWYTGYNSSDVMKIGYATFNAGTQAWDKYDTDGGPVFSGTGVPGAWDEKGVGAPCVIKVADNDYRMWYTGYKEVSGEKIPQIGYATSSDGIDWTPDVGNPVLTPGAGDAWDNKGVHSCWVIREDATHYKMWYTGRTGTSLIGNSAIGYTTSTDGIAGWNANKVSNPVLNVGANGSWDESGVAVPSVVYANSKYTMWYTGYSGFTAGSITSAIGVAQSTDGITSWTKNAKPVVTKGASGWNAGSVGAPRVYEASSTRLVMVHSGFNDGLTPNIGTATVQTVQFNGYAKLQGTDRPYPTDEEPDNPNGFDVPLTLKFYDPSVDLNVYNIALDPGESIVVEGVTYSYVAPMFVFAKPGDIVMTGYNPDTSVLTTSFRVNVPSGIYKVTLHTPHALTTLKQVTISGTQTVNMGTLREGNPNEDEQIAIGDYSLVLNDYLSMAIEPYNAKWNGGRCDFDRDGQVRGPDFSILSMNYTQTAPQSA